jgi:hypothetical protein
MTERRWTVSSTWMMSYQPDYLDTANYFGKAVGIIDLEMNPHESYDGDVLWAITFTYLRQDSENFGELLQEFDKLTEFGAFNASQEESSRDNELGDGEYDDLPF